MMKMGRNERGHAHGESLFSVLQSFGTMIATRVIFIGYLNNREVDVFKCKLKTMHTLDNYPNNYS